MFETVKCKIRLMPTQINIDFEKAFDTVEWDYIYRSLEFFKFPSKIVKWVKLLYTDISTSIINNGEMSKSFKPGRGVRQGCPASPYIFGLTAETLALYIKQKSGLEGINIRQIHFLKSQFADDTTLFIKRDEQNIHKCINTLNTFEQV